MTIHEAVFVDKDVVDGFVEEQQQVKRGFDNLISQQEFPIMTPCVDMNDGGAVTKNVLSRWACHADILSKKQATKLLFG